MKTKWFRVATSGKTIDGREILPAQIDQMAASYDPAKYGARIWMEHFRSMLPDSPFKAYGDVLAVRAEDAGDGQRALFAQVDATQELMQLNAQRQKVYWSIEMDPSFAGTGQAYMVGLAITDSPAALSTEMFRFSIQSGKLPETAKTHLFSAQVEGAALQEEPADDKPLNTLLSKVTELLSGTKKTGADTQRFSQIEQALVTMATEVSEMKTAIAGVSAGAKPDPQLAAKVETLSAELASLKTTLAETSPTLFRVKSDGNGLGTSATDC